MLIRSWSNDQSTTPDTSSQTHAALGVKFHSLLSSRESVVQAQSAEYVSPGNSNQTMLHLINRTVSTSASAVLSSVGPFWTVNCCFSKYSTKTKTCLSVSLLSFQQNEFNREGVLIFGIWHKKKCLYTVFPKHYGILFLVVSFIFCCSKLPPRQYCEKFTKTIKKPMVLCYCVIFRKLKPKTKLQHFIDWNWSFWQRQTSKQ